MSIRSSCCGRENDAQPARWSRYEFEIFWIASLNVCDCPSASTPSHRTSNIIPSLCPLPTERYALCALSQTPRSNAPLALASCSMTITHIKAQFTNSSSPVSCFYCRHTNAVYSNLCPLLPLNCNCDYRFVATDNSSISTSHL